MWALYSALSYGCWTFKDGWVGMSVSVGSFGIVYTKYFYICVIAISNLRWNRENIKDYLHSSNLMASSTVLGSQEGANLHTNPLIQRCSMRLGAPRLVKPLYPAAVLSEGL